MNVCKHLFKRTKLDEVFTPNTIAKLTYVKRNTIETDLEKYLSLPGKQIVIYGHSGSGKTTLLRNKLKELKQNFIRTHCQKNTSFDDLLFQAFDELNRFYIAEKTTNHQYSINRELKTEYKNIGSMISSTRIESKEQRSLRIVPPQLTPQKLAQFLGEIHCVWLIEDFHKVDDQEKLRIADVIKIFIDSANDYRNVKVVCIGAVGTARELIELDNNLNNRVAELFVPLLTNEEIGIIVDKGFDLLNVIIDKELRDKIVYYSNHLASITHQICYNLCFHSEIKKAKIIQKKLESNSFKEAVNSYVRENSDTYTKIYDTIISREYGWYVLKTFENSEKEQLTLKEIESKMRIGRQNKVEKEDLRNFLEKLSSEEYQGIVRLDRNSQKYSIASPFFKAFLKMKIALEKSEQNEAKKRKNNKLYKKYDIDSQKMIIDDQFFNHYNEILEKILAKEIKKMNLK